MATVANAQLSGTYTIGSSSDADYPSFTAAAEALTAGVAGPVLFQVEPGTYNEYFSLGEIAGASATNRVTFLGMGSDNQQVTVTYNAGYTSNATLTLNETDYVTFLNMTFANTSDAKARVMNLSGGIEYDRFYEVRFVGSVSTSNLDNDKDLVYRQSGAWTDVDNEFVGCEFVNGFIALYYQGNNMSQFNDGLLVQDCLFTNQCSKSIYITFTDHVIVSGNTINNSHDIKSNYNAIDVYRGRYGCIFEDNVINVQRSENYTEVFKLRPCTGTADEPVVVRNNVVNLDCDANYSYAYVLDNAASEYIYFAHNTARCTGSGVCGNLFVEGSWENLFIYNNLLVNETSGYVFRFQSGSTTGRYSDYNRVAFSGMLGRVSSDDYSGLAEWNALGFDTHSALCTPEFVSDNDLHITASDGLTVANALDYVTTDLDDEPRSATPCAGADEFLSGSNLPPVVQNPIDDVVFESYPASQTLSLANTFSDPDDPDEDIVIALSNNSNPNLVGATLDGRMLTVQRMLATGGSSTITLTATSNGQSVDASFTVECVAEDLPPVVANPLDPIVFTEYPQSFNFVLSDTFDDPDNNNNMIEITVQSCPSEVTAMYASQVLTVVRNTPNAFSNKVMVIRATSNGKQVDMEVLVSGEEVAVGIGTATFEDVALNAEGVWQPSQEGEATLFSGGWSFTSYYSSYFWGGFSASNHTDLTQTGMDAQYTAITGSGHEGSTQYAVAYTMGAQTVVSATDGSVETISGCYVTNNVWAYQNMMDGDYSATPFGGSSGNDPDWFKLTATGKNAGGQTMGTLDFYLADYRFSNNEEDYILDTWEWFDLSPLGPVASISFSLSSSKNNSYGMITPAYFCMDDFNGVGPETPDLPPYIANPVADLVFDAFPQTMDVNLDGVASDPDDDDEAIVYTLVSNSNAAALSAMLSGKTLVLNRLSEAQASADLVLRAFSDGQSVDFSIHVILNLVVDQPPVIVSPVDDVVFDLYPQSLSVDLDGVAHDPDDDDEDITYSIVSNSNTSALQANINGKVLILTRVTNTDGEAELVLRATSDGKTVDFSIHVVMHHYVGVEEQHLQVRVFPNPVESQLHLSVDGAQRFEYSVYDLLGQVVVQGRSQGEEVLLDASSWVKGIYFVAITREGGQIIEKVIR